MENKRIPHRFIDEESEELWDQYQLYHFLLLKKGHKTDIDIAMRKGSQYDKEQAELAVKEDEAEIQKIRERIGERERKRGEPEDLEVSTTALICSMAVLSFAVAMIESWYSVRNIINAVWLGVCIAGMTFVGVAITGGMQASLKWAYKSKRFKWLKAAITVLIWCAAIFLIYLFIKSRRVEL